MNCYRKDIVIKEGLIGLLKAEKDVLEDISHPFII